MELLGISAKDHRLSASTPLVISSSLELFKVLIETALSIFSFTTVLVNDLFRLGDPFIVFMYMY